MVVVVVVAMVDVGREVEVEAVGVVGVIVIAAHVAPGLVGVEAIRSGGGAGVGADCQDGTRLLTARFEDRQKILAKPIADFTPRIAGLSTEWQLRAILQKVCYIALPPNFLCALQRMVRRMQEQARHK
ncbi:unnamed protein product, partial [Symbiodinium sp. KB8]